MRFALRPEVRQEMDGEAGTLMLERPLRVLRVNRSLYQLIQGMGSEPLAPQNEAQARAFRALVKAGFALEVATGEGGSPVLPSVSVIIPVKDRSEELRRCLESLEALDYPRERLEVLVVDDGSTDETPQTALSFASSLGLRLLRSGAVGGGPALARNRGALEASGDILAFIDSDCTASEAWLRELVPAFEDASLGAVGGWVDGLKSERPLDRYEAVMSSLNLGKRAMTAGAGDDSFYLPSCNLLVRACAFRAVGGFRDEMHLGEDVDLTWRLRDRGMRIAYFPRGAVRHNHRNRLGSFLRRRFEYGTSEGTLQQLHPGRTKKMALPALGFLTLLCLLCAAGFRQPAFIGAAAMLFVCDTVCTLVELRQRRLFMPLVKIAAAKMRALGSLGYYLGYHLLRYYLIPLGFAAAVFPAVAPLVLAGVLGVAWVDYRVREPRMSFPLFCFYYLAEQLWYGLGVFSGCLRLRRFESYRMKFSPTAA